MSHRDRKHMWGTSGEAARNEGRTQLREKNHRNSGLGGGGGGGGGKGKGDKAKGVMDIFWNCTLQLYVHQVPILNVPLDGCWMGQHAIKWLHRGKDFFSAELFTYTSLWKETADKGFFFNLFIYSLIFFMQSVNSKLTFSPWPLDGLGTLEFSLPDPVFVVDSMKETPLRFYLFILLYFFFQLLTWIS